MSLSQSPSSQGLPSVNEPMIDSPPGLVVVRGPRAGTIFYLTSDVSTIGRAPDNDVRLEDRGVAPYHATIRRSPHGDTTIHYLYDLGSPAGVLVNGTRVGLRKPLNFGDRIAIGAAILEFFIPE